MLKLKMVLSKEGNMMKYEKYRGSSNVTKK
jgi:hypothetical protein